jgi:phosphoribosylanthranilate isomerase
VIRAKVCGITRREDALLAVELGASALGFVFWPRSPRAVTIEQARGIARVLPPFVSTVGVFVDQPHDEVLPRIPDVHSG